MFSYFRVAVLDRATWLERLQEGRARRQGSFMGGIGMIRRIDLKIGRMFMCRQSRDDPVKQTHGRLVDLERERSARRTPMRRQENSPDRAPPPQTRWPSSALAGFSMLFPVIGEGTTKEQRLNKHAATA